MKRQLVQILSITILICSISYAGNKSAFQYTSSSDCSPIRTDLPPNPASKIKHYDMDGLMMCTAYSNCYAADAERLRRNPNLNHLTSPLYLGIQYAKNKNQTSLVITDEFGISKSIRNMKSCSYDVVGDTFLNQKNGPFLSSIYSDSKQKNAYSLQCQLKAAFPSFNSINNVNNYLSAPNIVDFASKVFSDACQADTNDLSDLPELVSETTSKFGSNRLAAVNSFRNTLNSNLATGKPVGINYCQLALKNPSIKGISEDGTPNPDTCSIGISDECKVDKSKCFDGHSSNIVGRRLLKYKDGNTEKAICQYLVRDVYGSSCSKYPDDPSSNPSNTCEDGSVWMDEDAILFNTYETFHY
jgi:hypothetical protein